MNTSIHIGQLASVRHRVCRRRGLGLMVWGLVLSGAIMFAMPLYAHLEEGTVPLPGPIPSTLYEIELSYIGDRATPTVALSGPPAVMPFLPYRPFAPILDLLPLLGETRPFGSCQEPMIRVEDGIQLQRIAGREERCGQRIPLHRAEIAVDLLSYETLRIRGRATGSVVVAVEEDVAASRREDNLAIATVTGPFDLAIPLKEAGRRLDLRKLTALVVSTTAANAHIVFDRIDAVQPRPAPATPAETGFWVWTYRDAIRDPAPMIQTCRAQGCSRVLIQMPSQTDAEAVWIGYASLLKTVQEAGIAVLALDGYPEAIQEPHRLADKIQRLLALAMPGVLSGIQLDLEPYLLPGFLTDEAQLLGYIETIEMIKEAIGGRTRLSMVIPFWLASPTIAGRPLAFAVMDRADEVAVMSYRTDVDEVQDIAEDILRYGDVMGTPVWLAVETTPLPVEQHVVLRRAMQSDRADALVDSERKIFQWLPLAEGSVRLMKPEWFRIHHRFTVRPERLTFAGRSQAEVSAAVKQMGETLPHRSFSGVIIHDLDGFRALAASRGTNDRRER